MKKIILIGALIVLVIASTISYTGIAESREATGQINAVILGQDTESADGTAYMGCSENYQQCQINAEGVCEHRTCRDNSYGNYITIGTAGSHDCAEVVSGKGERCH